MSELFKMKCANCGGKHLTHACLKAPVVKAPVGYCHPTTILEFESVYRNEYDKELESCDRWIKWCAKQGDQYGVNFHQGMRSAHIFNNIKIGQLLRVLKQEHPNARGNKKP
jgi:hypothetical protein